VALAIVLPLLYNGCSPLGPCFRDQIEVSFEGAIHANEVPQSWDPRGAVTITNLDLPRYDRLRAALIEDTQSAAGAVWTFETGFGSQAAFLAVQLGRDPAQGEVLQVAGAFQGGGWGFLGPPAGGVLVAARFGEATATSASGTLEVLSTRPLVLAADLLVADGAGNTWRFDGVIRFERTVDEVVCD
jgi:hypothetical protein